MSVKVVTTVRFNHLPRISTEAMTLASAAVMKAAFDIEGWAKTKVPVDTGNLKNSLQTKQEDELTATTGSRGVEYAIYQEFGTYKMGAQPYLRPAADRVRPDFIKAMSHIIKV